MPITDHYARLPLDAIYIDRDERQRKELDTKGLLESIKIRGVLNPIIVERGSGPPHKLTAGERRYQACKELGLGDIPVRFADELSHTESQIFELEENIKRQDLTWQDETMAILRIHRLYCEMNPLWTQEKTARELGFTGASISQHLLVSTNIEAKPELRLHSTFKELLNLLTRKADREEAAKRDQLLFGSPLPDDLDEPVVIRPLIPDLPGIVVPPAPVEPDYKIDGDVRKNILLESFLMWAPKYSGPAFNLIHCDFPYGINVFDGPQSGVARHLSYDDSKEIHFKLLETLLVNFNRLASTSCHMMYWFSMQHYNQIRRMVAEIVPEMKIQTHPLIWHKSDNTGIASDPRHGPRHIYETALLMSRGDRPVVRLVSDLYAAPTDSTYHVHTKPEPMLRYFFGMLVDEHTVFLDPTCGSGSSIRAAESLGARTIVGMDTDEAIVGQARLALRQFRAKRILSLSNPLSL